MDFKTFISQAFQSIRRSLQVKLSLIMIGLSVIPLLIVSVIVFRINYKNQISQVLELEKEVSKRIAVEVNSYFEELIRELHWSVDIGGIHRLGHEAQKNRLGILQMKQKMFQELYLVDSVGNGIVSQSRLISYSTHNHLHQNMDYFTTPQKTNRPYVSPISIEKNSEEPIVYMSIPILNLSNGRFLGVLASEVRIKKIWELIAKIELKEKERVYIVDDRNIVIAHRNPSVVLRKTSFTPPSIDGFYDGLEGNEVVMAVRSIVVAGRTFTIVAERDFTEATKIARQTVVIMLGVLVVILLVIVFLVTRVVISIVRPINSLAQTAQLIEQGELTKRARVVGENEIGLLAQAFNTMTEKLHRSLESYRDEMVARQQTAQELMLYKDKLEIIVKERTQELENTHKKLIEAARLAGKAEIASGVLHNIGNVLNSVHVTSEKLYKRVTASKFDGLFKLSDLLDNHRNDLPAFFDTSKGKKVPHYVNELALFLDNENSEIAKILNKLIEHIKHMNEVVKVQSVFTISGGFKEDLLIDELISDSIKISEESLYRHEIDLYFEKSGLPPLPLDKHRMLQILINLINNAKDAMRDLPQKEKKIVVNVKKVKEEIVVTVKDNGIGISPEHRTRIFHHGFTTKKDGHGFGLHSSANAATEMGGALQVFSDGHQKGATFQLTVPVGESEKSNSARLVTTQS